MIIQMNLFMFISTFEVNAFHYDKSEHGNPSLLFPCHSKDTLALQVLFPGASWLCAALS